MSNLTIVLPLKDRMNLTKRWLAFAKEYYKDFNILILDGSKEDGLKNYLTINNFNKLLNLTYERYEYDHSIKQYFYKLSNGLSKVKTTFTVLIDNDDFFNPACLKKSVDFLTKNLEFSTCGGQQMQFSIDKNKENIKFYKDNRISSNIQSNPLLRLQNSCSLKLSLPLFYDVHRTLQIQDSYQKLDKMQSNELQLVEIFPQFMDSLNGKNMKLNDLYLLREIQIKQSAHREYLIKTGSILNRLIYSDFANDYKKIINNLSAHYNTMNINIEKDFEKKIINYLFIYLQSLILPKKIKKLNFFKKIKNKYYDGLINYNINFQFTNELKTFLIRDYL